MSVLARRSIKAFLSSSVGTMARVVLQLGYTILLARILGPEPFGIAAAAWLVVGAAQVFASFGFSTAIVQRKSLSVEAIRYAFTVQTLLGVLTGSALFVFAEHIGAIFRSVELVEVVKGMASVCAFVAMSQVSLGLLRRELDFAREQAVLTISNLIGFFGIGIPLALLDHGVWSLVWAYVSQAALQFVFAYAFVRHPITPCIHIKEKDFLSFSALSFANNIVNHTTQEAATFVIGRFRGMTELGLYNRAQALVSIPAGHLTAMFKPVLFSTCSKAQDNKNVIINLYLSFLGIISMIVWPAMAVAAVLAGPLVQMVYSEAWLDSVPVLVPLALMQPIQLAAGGIGVLLWGIGEPRYALRENCITLALLLPTLAITSQVSLAATAWGLFFVRLLRYILFTITLHRLLGIFWGRLVMALRSGLILSIACAGTALFGKAVLASELITIFGQVISVLILVAIVYMAVILLIPRFIFSTELATIIKAYPEAFTGRLRFLSFVFVDRR